MEGASWPSHLDSIIDEFKDCFDSMERYELLFEYAKKHPSPLPLDEWEEGNQVLGCQSRAHVKCSLEDNGLFLLRAGADAQIVQGLMAITAIAVNGLTPVEVTKLNAGYVEEMGLKASLTPSRANGFLNMFNRVISEAKILSEI
ncbi:MAG: SufE family protein [Candidatus Poseidoniales archaeon]|jgi:cysteine desulfuration protein SufE|nr:SufE family protein [Candidatus Poseidoniales archaeon]|tara:strand:- start:2908 stop:3339 length:432 start_codon:yes stop_codon:yes gene_type:complete